MSADGLKFPEIQCDPVGKVFFIEGRILRGIHAPHASSTLNFLKSDFAKEAMEEGWLPKSEVLGFNMHGFECVLEHEPISPHALPYEWSPQMLAKCTKIMMKLMEGCEEMGYVLRDPHPQNMVYGSMGPVYLDIGSFVPSSSKLVSKARREFRHSFLLAFQLTQRHRYELARSLLLRREPLPRSETHLALGMGPLGALWASFGDLLETLVGWSTEDWAAHGVPPLLAPRIKKLLGKKAPKAVPSSWKRTLTKGLPQRFTPWQQYQCTSSPGDQARFEEYLTLLAELGTFDRLVDLACNEGAFARTCLEKGVVKSACAIDRDSGAIDGLVRQQPTRMVPVLADVICPDGRAYDVKLQDRMISDVAVAFALIHHLFLKQGFPWETIVAQLSKYTRDVLLVEYMPLGLYDGRGTPREVPEAYAEEHFKAALEKHFLVQDHREGGPNRLLYVCRKRPEATGEDG